MRTLTDALPLGGRILDVEPTWHTRQWFESFNQFDYRTLSQHQAGADYMGDLATVKLPKGICHLIVCARGLGDASDLTASTLSLRRLCGANASALVRLPNDQQAMHGAVGLQRQLEEAGFSVRVAQHTDDVTPNDARQFGLSDVDAILIATAM